MRDKRISAKFASVCGNCKKAINAGDMVYWSRGNPAVHEDCERHHKETELNLKRSVYRRLANEVMTSGRQLKGDEAQAAWKQPEYASFIDGDRGGYVFRRSDKGTYYLQIADFLGWQFYEAPANWVPNLT